MCDYSAIKRQITTTEDEKGQRKFVGEQSSPQIMADAEHIEYAETPVIHKW